MSISQIFPVDVYLGLLSLKYWHSKILSKLSPWDLGLSWMCHLISVIVAEGPKVCIVLCLHTLIAKGERGQGAFEKLWHTDARNTSSAGLYLARYKGSVKKTRGFLPVTNCCIWSSPLHSSLTYYAIGKETEERTKSVLSVFLRKNINSEKNLELFGSMLSHRCLPMLYLGKPWMAGPAYAAS